MKNDSPSVSGIPLTPIVSVTNLQSLLEGFSHLISFAAALPKTERDPLVRSGVEARYAPEVERQAADAATSGAMVDQAKAVIRALADQKTGTPCRLPLSEPRACFPAGLDFYIFLACLTIALLVTVCDGANACLLAARYLQSLLAGLAFLAPALCAPLVAKAAISQFPARPRFWAELGLGLSSLACAAFFGFQFVTVFTTTPSPDDVVTDGIPGLKFVYLAAFALGFFVVYFLLGKALSLIRREPADQENPEYQKVAAHLSAAEQSLSVSLANAAALPARLATITTYKDHTFRVVIAACEARASLLRAEEDAAEARTSVRSAAAQRDWAEFGHALGLTNGHHLNGSFSPAHADS